MTGPSQPAMSENVQKARQRLLRLGLTDEHVLSLGPVATRSFDSSQLQYTSSDPHFGAMVQRLLRFLRGGRGLSIAVTDDGQTGEARIHTALQLATGLSRQGIQVVVVDMDFLHPGLGGLVEDGHTEGLIDMVRFGRSCRSLLYKPVAEGPSILACGSFPVLEPMPLDEDAVRSVLHRVSLHCELALYVAPLQPDGQELNPVVRLCEHVVLVHSVSPSAVDIVERIQLMQQARLHVAGVVLFEAAQPQWQRESLPQETAPEPAVPPLPEHQQSTLPPVSAATQPEASEVPLPHIPWNAPKAPATTPETLPDDTIPEINLPNEENRSGPLPATVAEGERLQAPYAAPSGSEPGHEVGDTDAANGEEAVEGLWSDPSREPMSESAPETESEWTPATSPDASGTHTVGGVARSTDDFDAMEFDDSGTEFAYDDGNSWSKTPLYILITLLVLTGGFFGWALWTKRGIEQQIDQQLSDTEWIDSPTTNAVPDAPDDAAAMPEGDGKLPAGGLDALTDEVDPEPADTVKQPAPPTPEKNIPQTPPRAVDASPKELPTEAMTPIQVRPEPGRSTDSASSAPGSQPPTTTGAGTHEYTVHVGSFRNMEQAYKDIATLQKYGYTGRAVRTDLGDKGIWYRVYVGGFPNRAEAEKSRNGILEHPEYRYAQVKRVPR